MEDVPVEGIALVKSQSKKRLDLLRERTSNSKSSLHISILKVDNIIKTDQGHIVEAIEAKMKSFYLIL